jgi:hypothetical protein
VSDRPRFDVGQYRTEVIVIALADHTEIRRPDMDEPLILKPGEQMRFGFAAGVTAEGYIEGVGWDAE